MAPILYVTMVISMMTSCVRSQSAFNILFENENVDSRSCTTESYSGIWTSYNRISKTGSAATVPGLPSWVTYKSGPWAPANSLDLTDFHGLSIYGPNGQDGIQDTMCLRGDAYLESDDWCTVLSNIQLVDPTHAYRYAMRFKLIDSKFDGQDFGQAAMLYNVIDHDNFDFIITRFNDAQCVNDDCVVCGDVTPCTRLCIQLGYMEGGTPHYTQQLPCQYDPNLTEGREIRYSLTMRSPASYNRPVEFSINGHEYVLSLSPIFIPHFPLNNKVGVGLLDGADNILDYRYGRVLNWP